jgi:hypothetical protein
MIADDVGFQAVEFTSIRYIASPPIDVTAGREWDSDRRQRGWTPCQSESRRGSDGN